LQIFLAAFDAVEVVGPTDPESWAEQQVERIEMAAAAAERAWKSFIIKVWMNGRERDTTEALLKEGYQNILKVIL
jgi:hypothetical protein